MNHICMCPSIGTQQFNNHNSRFTQYHCHFPGFNAKTPKIEFFVLHELKLNLLYTNLAVKTLSAVSRDPSGPSISVFGEKCRKDVPFFFWKPSPW